MRTQSLRIVFFGTPDFAAASLLALSRSVHHIVGVVTGPDRPAGRGQKLQPSQVKVEAQKLSLPLVQPQKLRGPEFLSWLEALNADLFVVVAFRMLPEVVWRLPRIGTVNIHGSLLPDFRGAAPIQHAVASGAKRTGVTSFFITEDIDTGALLLQQAVAIGSDESSGEVYTRLMHAGGELAVDTADALSAFPSEGVDQSLLLTGAEKPAPKLFRQDGRIDWRKSTHEVANFIRGMTPYPGAWTTLNGATLKIRKTEATVPHDAASRLSPGQCLMDGEHWWVGTEGQPLRLLEVQLAGKPFLPASDVLRGYRYPIDALGTDGH